MHLLILLGQTCSGKSETAVKIAHLLGKKNCWIVNCDSRQIYKDLNIGTAKVQGKWEIIDNKKTFIYKEIPHFLIDFVNPFAGENLDYSLVKFIQDFNQLFLKKPNFETEKLPKFVILTGGTGLFAKAIFEEYKLGLVKIEFENKYQNFKQSLSELSLVKLQKIFLEKCIEQKLNSSDFANPRRLISKILRNHAEKQNWQKPIFYPKFTSKTKVALKINQIDLQKKIQERVVERLDLGLLKEVLEIQTLGQKKIMHLGLEYRLTQIYLNGALTRREWEKSLFKENLKYAKRQLTWLKKENPNWLEIQKIDLKSWVSQYVQDLKKNT